MTALFDHLWQSTLFAAAIGLLTLAFRRHGAALRYGLWFAASMKFLLPFQLLTASAGAFFQSLPSYGTALPLFHRMQAVASPFAVAAPDIPLPPAMGLQALPLLLLAVWACGAVALAARWLLQWMRLRAVVRAARDVTLAIPLPAKVSTTLLEPGLVGIRRPVLLLPEGILTRLTAAEMRAVETHELCHFRRRDNLTAALHMLVAVLFWFHPLVWWIGGRLLEERERACDEDVLAGGNDPQAYAQSILKVCQFCVHSPLACAAGMAGANLSNRMEKIMKNQSALRLGTAGKVLLGAAAAITLAVPVWAGTGAQPAAAPLSHAQIERNLAEQRKPRVAIALDPARFDAYAGYYRMQPNGIFVISREGNRYFQHVIGQDPVEMFADSENEFFLKGLRLPAQFSFAVDASGRATEMVLHQSGEEQHAVRIDDAEGKAAQEALDRRIALNVQSPGTEAALRHQIDGLMQGKPDYDSMAPTLAAGTRQMLPALHADIAKWGAVVSVTFTGVGRDGMDNYLVVCRNARSKWEIAPLQDGKIAGIFFEKS